MPFFQSKVTVVYKFLPSPNGAGRVKILDLWGNIGLKTLNLYFLLRKVIKFPWKHMNPSQRKVLVVNNNIESTIGEG